MKIASNWGDREGVKAPPQSYMVGMSNTVVRIFKHEESFEVSSLDVLLFRRQAVNNRMTPEAAKEAARAYAMPPLENQCVLGSIEKAGRDFQSR